MSEKTGISWADSTVNPVSGCSHVSAGCQHCYAETLAARFPATFGQWGDKAPRKFHPNALKLALRLNRKPWVCGNCGSGFKGECTVCNGGEEIGLKPHRRRIFWESMGDIGDPQWIFEWFNQTMVTIDQCRDVTHILCTKRPAMFLTLWEMACRHWGRTDTRLPKNVIMLASVENQEMADKRIPELLKIPAAVRGLSLEPLLGPVRVPVGNHALMGIDWLVIGGESGPKARPCNVNWIRRLVQQGQAAGVAVFVKQLGSWVMDYNHPFAPEFVAGRLHSKHPKGGDPAEWPKDLQVQQWPAL